MYRANKFNHNEHYDHTEPVPQWDGQTIPRGIIICGCEGYSIGELKPSVTPPKCDKCGEEKIIL